MQVVGRADHQQVKLRAIEHGLEAVICRADRDVVLLGVGQAGRLGIDIADHREVRALHAEYARQIAQTIPQADDPCLHSAPLAPPLAPSLQVEYL